MRTAHESEVTNMSKLEMLRVAKKSINEQCYCQVLQKNLVLLESGDGYILCRDIISGNEFRITEEMYGWEVNIVFVKPVAELS